MTAEFMEYEIDIESDHPTKPRDINELIDLEYSEMTDEEIGIVVEFKANVIARDAEHEKQMQMLHDHLEEQARINMEAAKDTSDLLDRLTRHAIDRFESESNG